MNLKDKKFLIVIAGPTGIGKTGLSINIAGKLHAEIISADSRQFYRELGIGAAAPTTEQLEAVKHHCVGNKSVKDYYSIYKFEQDVLDILQNIYLKSDTAIMTGGSGLYIDAVCKGVDDIPDIDESIRKDVLHKYREEGVEGIRFEIKKLDPDYYDIADLKNPKRLIRALEVCKMTGKAFSSFRTGLSVKRTFNIIQIGLNRDRKELYDLINLRVDNMINKGLVKEAKALFEHRGLNSLNTVGYKELFPYFEGVYSLERAIDLIKRNSRRYAKRQLTWFNKNKNIRWFHPDDQEGILDYLSLVTGHSSLS